MPPCVHHRFSRLPIARIHLSHRSPELISAFASVRPSARSTTIHAPSRSFLPPSQPPPVCSPSLSFYPPPPHIASFPRYPTPLIEVTLAAVATAAAVPAVPSIVDTTRLEREKERDMEGDEKGAVEGRTTRGRPTSRSDVIANPRTFRCLLISLHVLGDASVSFLSLLSPLSLSTLFPSRNVEHRSFVRELRSDSSPGRTITRHWMHDPPSSREIAPSASSPSHPPATMSASLPNARYLKNFARVNTFVSGRPGPSINQSS